jgi:hypothetical protein
MDNKWKVDAASVTIQHLSLPSFFALVAVIGARFSGLGEQLQEQDEENNIRRAGLCWILLFPLPLQVSLVIHVLYILFGDTLARSMIRVLTPGPK